MLLALFEHAMNMRGERHEAQQMFAQQPLARLQDERACECGQLGMPGIRRSRQGLEQTRDLVDGGARQRQRQTARRHDVPG